LNKIILSGAMNVLILQCYGWFPIFQKNREKQKKNDGKMGIFTRNQFSTKLIFLYGCSSKTNHCKYLKFSPNVYVRVIYVQQLKLLIIFVDNKMFLMIFVITLKILENFTITHKYNFFLLAFEDLNFGVFRPLKHKSPFFTDHWKLYPKLTNHLRLESN
ncbi:Uncharacterized protein FWK35_00022940, partial [Aphis craccivora]